MRKCLLLAVLVIVIMVTSVSFAASDISVYLNDELIEFPDGSPYISNNRTLVPVRFIAESMGAEVGWNQDRQEVTIVKDTKVIVLKIGEMNAMVNGKPLKMDVSATIKDSRTYVPLRFVSESFSALVNWDQYSKSILISAPTIQDSSTLKGKDMTMSDLFVHVGDGKYIKTSEDPYTIMSILGKGTLTETGYTSPNNEQYREYEYQKDGIRVYFYENPNIPDSSMSVHILSVGSPQYPTLRGLKIGDSYDRMIELYGKPSNSFSDNEMQVYQYISYPDNEMELSYTGFYVTFDRTTNKIKYYNFSKDI